MLEDGVKIITEGIINSMKRLKMLDGEPAPAQSRLCGKAGGVST